MGFILASYMRVLNTYLVSSKALMYVLLLLSMFQFCSHIRIILHLGCCFCPKYAKIFIDSVFILLKVTQCINESCSPPIVLHFNCSNLLYSTPVPPRFSLGRTTVRNVLHKRSKSLRPQVANLNVSY